MKNNSFKFNGPFPKKLVLTALLATVLSGPYVYQISSKDFSTSEFASTASETAEVDRLQAEYEAHQERVLDLYRKSNPANKDAKELPKSDSMSITDETLKAKIKEQEARKATLDTKLADIKIVERTAEIAKKRIAEKDEAIAAEKKRKEDAEAAEKKKKADAEEAKKNDCNDKDKNPAERRECREVAKEEEKKKKTEDASKRFEDRLDIAMKKCESSSSSREKESVEDKELACKSKAFVSALNKKDKDLSQNAVNAQFRHLIGEELFAMLYSEDDRDAERASILLSNIFNGKIAQYPGLKRMIMDEVRRKTTEPAKKVTAEFRKANSLPKGHERDTVFNAALTAKGELDARVDAYKNSMLQPLQKIGEREAIAYYHSAFRKPVDDMLLKIMTGSTSIGGEVGGSLRGGVARGGTSTEAAVIRGADGKMTQSGGVEYSLLHPGTIEHISFGTPRSTRRATENGTTESEKLRLGTTRTNK